MLRTRQCFKLVAFVLSATLITTGLITTAALSEDAPAEIGRQRQRVSPKVLREAMRITRATAEAAKPQPPAVEELLQLAEKLKKDGDEPAADLLQRFIAEHRRLVSESLLNSESNDGRLEIRCEIIEVFRKSLPSDSKLISISQKADAEHPIAADEIRDELSRLVAEKKARIRLEHSFSPKVDQTSRCESRNALDASESTIAVVPLIAGEGTIVEILTTRLSKDQVRFHWSCEFASPELINLESSVNPPNTLRVKTKSKFEMTSGETKVMALGSSTTNDVLRFFLSSVAKR